MKNTYTPEEFVKLVGQSFQTQAWSECGSHFFGPKDSTPAIDSLKKLAAFEADVMEDVNGMDGPGGGDYVAIVFHSSDDDVGGIVIVTDDYDPEGTDLESWRKEYGEVRVNGTWAELAEFAEAKIEQLEGSENA